MCILLCSFCDYYVKQSSDPRKVLVLVLVLTKKSYLHHCTVVSHSQCTVELISYVLTRPEIAVSVLSFCTSGQSQQVEKYLA